MLNITDEDIANACSSKRFVSLVASRGPFEDVTALSDTCRYVWWNEVQHHHVSPCLLLQSHAMRSSGIHTVSGRHVVIPLQARVTDWLEAYAAHPRIGDLDSLRAKYTQFARSSQTEQATAASASGDTLQVPQAPSVSTTCYKLSKTAEFVANVPVTAGIEIIQ